jgi:gas vesicle protein
MAANSVNRYFEGLLVGGTLGFVFGLLTAPKPGAELRRELADTADDMLRELDGRMQPLQDKAEFYKERVATQASIMKSKVNEKSHDLRDKMSDKLSTLKEKASDIKEKIDEKVKSGDGADLLNNYMGNNSGPMYTAGAKVAPDASAMPVSDSCSNYSAGKAGEGAAGG